MQGAHSSASAGSKSGGWTKFRAAVRTIQAVNRFSALQGHKFDIDGNRVPSPDEIMGSLRRGEHVHVSVDGYNRCSFVPQVPAPASAHEQSRFAATKCDSIKEDLLDVVIERVPEERPSSGAVKPGFEVTVRSWLAAYFGKWRGVKDSPIGRPPPAEAALTFFGSFAAILLLSALTRFASPHMDNIGWIITSFGASVVLLFAVPESKLVQPRNCFGGQIIGAVIGTSIRLALGADFIWLSAPLGTALAISIMQLTSTTHPPGGGTALFAASMPVLLPWQGYQIVVTAIIGSVGLLVVALIVNNLSPKRQYPTFWLNQRF